MAHLEVATLRCVEKMTKIVSQMVIVHGDESHGRIW